MATLPAASYFIPAMICSSDWREGRSLLSGRRVSMQLLFDEKPTQQPRRSC